MLGMKRLYIARRAAVVAARAHIRARTHIPWVRFFSATLPEGWEQITRRNGDIVYYNSALRKTVRELPGFPHQSNRSEPAHNPEKNASKQEPVQEAQVVGHHEPTENEVFVPIDFDKAARIEGHESQVIHIDLEPQQCLRAESGAMIYMTDGIDMETTTAGGFQQGAKRLLTGENFFVTRFTYRGDTKGTVALGTSFPSKILHFRLEDHIGHSIICQKGAFLCGSDTVNIEMEFAKNFGVGFFGGEGFILQRLTGSGDAFVRASGALIQRDLEVGEVLRISSGCLVAFEPTVAYDVTMMKGVKNVMFGGEGLFVTTLTGPGKIYIQSLPFDRVVGEIASRVPRGGGHGMMFPFFGGGGSEGARTPSAEDAGADAGAPPEEGTDSTWDSSSVTDSNIYGGASGSESSFSNAEFDDMDGDGSETVEGGAESVVDFFRDFFGGRD